MLQMIFAARMLQPAELGLWAVLLMTYRLFTPFVEGGWNRAIIREKILTKEQIDTLFTCNVAIGMLAAILLCLGAETIAVFFSVGVFSKYAFVFSFVFVAIGLGSLRGNILQKELQFQRIALIQITSVTVEFVIFLYMLFHGFMIWSLLIPFLIRFYIQHLSYLFWSDEKIDFALKLRSVLSIFRFARFDLGSQLLNYFYTNIDNIIVGRLFGQTALGFYSLAWDITVKPISFFNPIILRVAFPLMSKAAKVKAIYYQILWRVGAVQIPLYIVLGSCMYWIIVLIYGSQWLPAQGLATILCGVAVLRAIAEPGASVLAVKGRFDFEFYFQILNIIITGFSISIFYKLGPQIENIAWAMLFAHVLLMSFWFWWIEKNVVRTEIDVE